MRTVTLIMFAAAACLMAFMCGCSTGDSRREKIESRWEQKIEETRLEAARTSMAEGRYAFARKALEPCVRSGRQGRRHRDVEQLMVQIEAADQMYAQLRTFREEDEQERVY